METVEYKNISFTVWDVGGQVRPCYIYSAGIFKTEELAITFRPPVILIMYEMFHFCY